MSHRINLTRISGVYNALEELQKTVVFVGGATVSLYADKPEQADVRPTEDIDVLIEIGSYASYVKIQEELLRKGFEPDKESKVICRYKYQGLTVDVMPTDESILGFSNKWYKKGFININEYKISDQTTVNIFKPTYFIASKLEAFKGRGENDGRTSRDFEDVVFVLDNRAAIWQEISKTDEELQRYLKEELTSLLANRYIEEWISAHLEYSTATARTKLILTRLKEFVSS